MCRWASNNGTTCHAPLSKLFDHLLKVVVPSAPVAPSSERDVKPLSHSLVKTSERPRAENRPFIVVECLQSAEPVGELAVKHNVVRRRGRLKQLDLRQDLELATPLVEVDETVVGGVAERCVDHHQVGEKRAEIRHRTLHDRSARLYHADNHNAAPSV